jgi:hypothetical protein
MVQLQLCVRLLAAKLAKAIYDQSMPGQSGGNSDSERSSFAKSDPLRTQLRLGDVPQNPSNVGQKQLSRCVQAHPSRQSVKKGKSQLPFQILDLTRQGRLRDVKPFCSATEVLFLANTHKISQVPKFHRYLAGMNSI